MVMLMPQEDGREENGHGDVDGVDHISGLPEELLLELLAHLGCAREAARTSVLSRRWLGLWTRLPEYTFDGVEPESVEAALAQVTRPKLDGLNIKAELKSQAAVGRASSLLRAAARLEPGELSATLLRLSRVEAAEAIELPCFDRTCSLTLVLQVRGVPVTHPPAGEFTRLESLELATGYMPDALLPSCPRLRVLRIHAFKELKDVAVRSATLEELACMDEAPDWSFAELMAQLPVTDFSVLELVLETGGHAFGPLLLHLPQIRPVIRRLELVIEQGEEAEEEEPCPENCPCRQPINWKSENISLTDLEQVLISYDFRGGNEEVDFVKLLFRCAPGLKRMDVGVCGEVNKEICSICEENSHVKCDVSYSCYYLI